MKGVSTIIVIVLILMIVVALAALAYTWFTGVFATLTGTTETAVTTTTGAMGANFQIETASSDTTADPNNVTVVIRNVGTQSIDLTKIAAYVNDVNYDIENQAALGSIENGESGVFKVLDVPSPCNKAITVTIETGLSKSAVIECPS
jgi:FlaG/FlaF family flagellin (archaellin)